MKRGVLVVLMMLLMVGVVAAQVEVPAPFAKAKEIAMRQAPDFYGRYLAVYEWKENGTDYALVLGFLPSYRIIGVGMLSPEEWVIEFNVDTGEMTVWTSMGRLKVSEKDRPVAFEYAFRVFRMLVEKGLI